jgi:hypothetical protein
MSRRWIPVLAVLILVMVPEVAHACPVCFDPRDQNRGAFLATTAFMSLFPLGMLGSVGLWLRRRSQKLQESEDEEGSSPEE